MKSYKFKVKNVQDWLTVITLWMFKNLLVCFWAGIELWKIPIIMIVEMFVLIIVGIVWFREEEDPKERRRKNDC